VDGLEIGAQVKVNFNVQVRMGNKESASTNFANLEPLRYPC
jgi:hypothetical protein